MTSNTPLGGTLGVKLTETVTGTGTSLNQGNQIKVGTRISLNEDGEAVYVHAAEAITRYQWVAIEPDGEARILTSALMAYPMQPACATFVSLADNDFGWVATKGQFKGNLLTASSVDAVLYTGATAGQLTSTSVTASVRIEGVIAVSTSNQTTNGAAPTVMAVWPKSFSR